MAYAFEKLPQTVDKRGKLTEHRSRAYPKRTQPLKKLERAIHHSLTRKDLAGSSPEGFSRYHVNTLGWPAIGYSIVITPNEVVDTPEGKRAKIHYCVDLKYLTYNVGNSNWIALGINIAGDYRYDKLDGPTMASFVDLLNALDKDQIAMGGMFSHHQYPGYSWKKCCVFDPQYAIKNGKKFIDSVKVTPNPVAPVPSIYTVQEGDTLYSIAKSDDRFDVDDLMKWNKITDPSKLRVGQPLKLRNVDFSDETESNWVYPKNGLAYRKEEGVFTNTSGSRIAARDGYPNFERDIAAWLSHGDTFTYDRVYTHAGFVWISKMYKGKRRFLPVRTHKNGVDGEAWGNFK